MQSGKSRSGTFLMIGMVCLIVGLLIAANFRLRAHRRLPGSMAVLPFVRGSRDVETARLCDEITEAITRDLSTLPRLKVLPPASVAKYQNTLLLNPQRAGRELNVDVVVVGRVERKRDMILVQTDLVNVTDESQLWGYQYEQKLSDSLASDIAKDISNQVRLTLFPKD